MKKNTLIVGLVCALSIWKGASAQTNSISVNCDVGYGFPSGVQSYTNSYVSNRSIVPYSLGAGINLGAEAYYMFTDNFGAGLGINGIVGTPITYVDNPSPDITKTMTSTGSLFDFVPGLVLSTNNQYYNPYASFGLLVGFASYTTNTVETGSSAQAGTKIDMYSGNIALGWCAAFGIRFRINETRTFNIELFDRDLVYSPMLYTNQKAFDGDSKSAQQLYVNSTNNPYGSKTLAYYVPFGSMGLRIGMAWEFDL